jgi:Ca2+-binding RTX toxin-like protein|tara:strand:- start:23919 stop:30743 length:6825 start_codon:yes stop_codon:yes gene_type:complete
MNSTKTVFDMGQLAALSYEEYGTSINTISTYSGSFIVDTNSYQLLDSYKVIDYVSSIDGMDAVLFSEIDSVGSNTGKYVVAFRGTLGPVDIATNIAILAFNHNAQLNNALNFVQQMMINHNISASDLTLTGHSLGGMLSQLVGAELHIQAYGFNPYGSNSLSSLPPAMVPPQIVLGHLMDTFGLGAANDPWVKDNILTISYQDEGQVNGDVLSNLVTEVGGGGHLGGILPIFGPNLGLVDGHRIDLLNAAITHYNSILAHFDSSTTLNDLSLIYLLGGDTGFTQAEHVFAELDILNAPEQSLLLEPLGGVSVAGELKPLSTAEVALAAGADSDSGRAYRYALLNLNPFVISGDSTLYTPHSSNGELDVITSSSHFLTDRAMLLSAIIQQNIEGSPHPEKVNGQTIRFHDEDIGEVFAGGNTSGQGNSNTIDPDTVTNIIFGNDSDNSALHGGDQDDRLYGQAGNDTLIGGDGDDYLEGGKGDDTYRIAWGTGVNDLIGNLIVDEVGDNTLEIQHGVGGAFQAVTTLAAVGEGLYSELNAHGQPLNDTRYFLQGADLVALTSGGNRVTLSGFLVQGGVLLANKNDNAFGITFDDAPGTPSPAVVAEHIVATLGSGASETRWDAYDRDLFAQGGLDWDPVSIDFDAGSITNYTGGTLHGTVGGAFFGGPTHDNLAGDAAQNALHGWAGDDIITGGDGDDFLEGGSGSDHLWGGAGSDILFGSADQRTRAWTQEIGSRNAFYLPQILDVSSDVNALHGDDGNDFLSGGEYRDLLDGGADNDYVFGGTGQDHIHGGNGQDVIYGDSSLNYSVVEVSPGVAGEELSIVFADGTDVVGSYDDVIHAGSGNDIVWGELGDDTIYGGDGDDNLLGDRHNDLAYFSAELSPYGSTQPDLGGSFHGDDRLYGGAGDDLLVGHGGNDFLSGGHGSDTLSGGLGDDTYFFEAGDGIDYIDDEDGQHKLVFRGISPNEVQILFQGNQVFVGTGHGQEGFYFSRDEWPNVSLSFETPGIEAERSVVDAVYLDSTGTALLTIKGDAGVTEAERDNLFTIDTSGPKPKIVFSEEVQNASLEAINGGGSGSILRISNGFDLNFVVNLAVDLAANASEARAVLEMLSGIPLNFTGYSGDVYGTDGDDHIIGSSAGDYINGNMGNDLLEGRSGNDVLAGSFGDDALLGGAGNDDLDGGYGNDRLEGGTGDDLLDGGPEHDTYAFSQGDGQDTFLDVAGYHYFEFNASVHPEEVVLYLTGTTLDDFRLEYSSSDHITSTGVGSAYWITSVSVAGEAIPLIQRSDLANGSFFDTRYNDVFQTGAGIDTIHLDGWGDDVVQLSQGDDADIVTTGYQFQPAVFGDIRFADDVDLQNVSFSFDWEDTSIDYGTGDSLALSAHSSLSHGTNNVLSRFTLSSAADPAWIPTISPSAYGGAVYGSFGADDIVGTTSNDWIRPSYGDDFIFGDAGDDSIYLNHIYFEGANTGIGAKHITAGAGNDLIETPLFQGVTYHFDAGHGRDTIVFDWDYSASRLYDFQVAPDELSADFYPVGQDELILGGGINLSDLRFFRAGNTLHLQISDDSQGIVFEEFFHAYEAQSPVGPVDVGEIFSEGNTSGLLMHPYILSILPGVPISTLTVAGDASYNFESLLDTFLKTASVYGTDVADVLGGGVGDDMIFAGDGDDTITDIGGANEIYAGSGNDVIEIDGQNHVEAGSGDDYVQLNGGSSVVNVGEGDDSVLALDGSHVFDFGSGNDELVIANGSHSVLFTPGSGNLQVSFANSGAASIHIGGGLVASDISLSLIDYGNGRQGAAIHLPGTGDTIFIDPVLFDEVNGAVTYPLQANDPIAGLLEVRFDNDSVLDRSSLYAAFGLVHHVDGTAGNDILSGGVEDDVIDGGAGDDEIYGLGGNDSIIGGLGDDTVVALDGNDSITDLAGVNHITAGGGDDTLLLDGDNTVLAGAGADYVEVFGGASALALGSGDDTILIHSGSHSLSMGSGFDGVLLTGGTATISFNTGDEINLYGFSGSASAVIEMESGLTESDITVTYVDIGAGALPTIIINSTGDLLTFAPVTSLGGGQWLPDFDTRYLVDGVSEIRFSDNSSIDNDELRALLGLPVRIYGTSSNDLLNGTAVDEEILSGSGSDQLNGAGGDDALFGGEGDDVLTGGTGDDYLDGGAGSDFYSFSLGDGSDSIFENDPNDLDLDVLDISGISYDELWFTAQGTSVVVDFVGTNDQITIAGDVDVIQTATHFLLLSQVDSLITAMSAYPNPTGVGASIPQQTRDNLDITLGAVWQAAS